MDNLIIDASIPSGSVILAYGSPSSRSRFPRILAILAGMFGILLALLILGGLTINNVPLPKDTVMLAYLPAKVTLPNGAPTEWNNDTRWPHFVGYAKNSDGTLSPFGIVAKTSSQTATTKTFAWKLVSTQRVETGTRSFFGLPNRIGTYFHGAWMRVDWDDLHLAGSIGQGSWKTDLKVAPSQTSIREFSGDGYLDMSAFSGAQDMSNAFSLLEGSSSDAFGASAIRWAHGTSTTAVAFDFAENLSSSTAVRIAAAAGLHDRVEVTLPDGSVRHDLHPPTLLLATSNTTTWQVGNLNLTFTSKTATFSSGFVGWSQTSVPTRCPGRLVAAFDPESQNRIRLGLGVFLPDIHSTLFWMEAGGRLQACW